MQPVEVTTPAFAIRGFAGDGAPLIDLVACVVVVTARRIVGSGSVGDFAVVVAEEPAAVLVAPSIPDFSFFCRYLRQGVILNML